MFQSCSPHTIRRRSLLHTFATRRPNRHAISGFKEARLRDCIVNFRLKDVEEAILADLLPSFWSLEYCPRFLAKSAGFRRHCTSTYTDSYAEI